MSFLVFLICGVCGGVLGGMGMGGGTALIPLLTIFCGVEQGAAQGVNLISFLPMSALALTVHAKNGLLKKEGIAWLIAPALLFSALFSVLAVWLPSDALRRGFGAFLVILSFFTLKTAFDTQNSRKKVKKSAKKVA